MSNWTNTIIDNLKRLWAANVSASSITNPTPTATEPADGVIKAITNGFSSNQVMLSFIGTRTDVDQTMTARVTGWKKIITASGNTLWVPYPILTLTITLGTSIGVANQGVVATEYFADTIVIGTAFTSAYEIVSPADNTIGYVKIDNPGFDKIQVDLAKGTCATCNCLGCGF